MADEPERALERREPQAVARWEPPSDDELRRMFRVADALAQSEMFRDVRSASQAFAKIILGRELGLNPAESMTAMHIIEGNPTMHYAMLERSIKAHGYSWTVEERSATRAAARFFDPDGVDMGVQEFTWEDAERAQLTTKTRGNKPSMYVLYPKNMLWARMVANTVRFEIPEATGGIPVYLPDEIPERAQLTAGEGSGESQGLDLGPQVEKILERAETLGHVGYADRATAEIALGGRAPNVVKAWVDQATKVLDEMEAGRGEQPVVAPEPDTPAETERVPFCAVCGGPIKPGEGWVADDPDRPAYVRHGNRAVCEAVDADQSRDPDDEPEVVDAVPVPEISVEALQGRKADLEMALGAPGMTDQRAGEINDEIAVLDAQIAAASNPDQGALDV